MIQIVSSKPDQDGKIFRASVHKELLCFFSPYYTAALKGGFAEAKKNTLTLDLSYHQMANLVSWLYSGDPVAYTEYELLDLYVFADEKMMLAFRRSIMTRLIKFNDPGYQHLDDDVAMPFVKRLPESSGLFRFLVDYWVGVWGRVDCRTRMAEWDADGRVPRKFFYQALEKFASLVDEPRPRDDSRDHRTCLTRACNYHEHPNRTEWERSMCIVIQNSLHPYADISSLQPASERRRLHQRGRSLRRILHRAMICFQHRDDHPCTLRPHLTVCSRQSRCS